jgi:hypothetical protein
MNNLLTSPQEQFSSLSGCIGTDHLFLQVKQNTQVFPSHVQLLQKLAFNEEVKGKLNGCLRTFYSCKTTKRSPVFSNEV